MFFIRTATYADRELVFGLVEQLLIELMDEHSDFSGLDPHKLLNDWARWQDRITVFIAEDGDTPAGLVTVTESIAIYAGGCYGVIDELWVHPDYRNRGVGRKLVEAALSLGRTKGWSRLDVTAPEDRDNRSRAFYEHEGFSFTGPKLKMMLR